MKTSGQKQNLWRVLLQKNANAFKTLTKKSLELKRARISLQNQAAYLENIQAETKKKGSIGINETATDLVTRQSFVTQVMELHAANQSKLRALQTELDAVVKQIGRLTDESERYKRLAEREHMLRLDSENASHQKTIDELGLMGWSSSARRKHSLSPAGEKGLVLR